MGYNHTIRRFDVAENLERVRERLTYYNDTETGFTHFLTKFNILDELTWDEWAIRHACNCAISDAIAQNVKALDISFSVDKYVRSGQWSYSEIICIICDIFKGYHRQIDIGPFLSISYHSSRENQLRVANLIDDKRVANCVVGLDLVGDEEFYDSDFYGPIIQRWNEAGKVTREHIAEMPWMSGNLTKIMNRPREQRPKRIAHGIHGTMVDFMRAADDGIFFDLALTSNIVTGAVNNIRNHPLPMMLKAGCPITLNTDDPVQFNCTLDGEYDLAINSGLITEMEAIGIQQTATESLRR